MMIYLKSYFLDEIFLKNANKFLNIKKISRNCDLQSFFRFDLLTKDDVALEVEFQVDSWVFYRETTGLNRALCLRPRRKFPTRGRGRTRIPVNNCQKESPAREKYLGKIVDDRSVIVEKNFEQMSEIFDLILLFDHSAVVETGNHLEGTNVLFHLKRRS